MQLLILGFTSRGITRITVTVVVIMFELTGALTYILPTMVSFLLSRSSFRILLVAGEMCTDDELVQIVVMVTKAVSDQFGGGGIADQMIRFNGFPLLENEDHAYNITGQFIALSIIECVLTVVRSRRGDEARYHFFAVDRDAAGRARCATLSELVSKRSPWVPHRRSAGEDELSRIPDRSQPERFDASRRYRSQ